MIRPCLCMRNTVVSKLLMHSVHLFIFLKADIIAERTLLKVDYFCLLEKLKNDYGLPKWIQTMKGGS